MRFEPVTKLLELCPYFEMIVDFAVEGYTGIAVVGKNRLVAGSKVDNFEASGAYRKKAGLKHALLVRPPMDQGRRCLPNARRGRRPVFMRKSDDSTQFFIPLGAPLKTCGVLSRQSQCTSGD